VFVNVGLGFHVEFTPTEALSFIELKEAHLTGYLYIAFHFCGTLFSHAHAIARLRVQEGERVG
jgi:hypothetical protein